MGSRYEHVFAPIRIRGVDFKNRLELAPPSPNLADRQGRVTTEFVDFFRVFANGGAAVLHVGNSVVDIREASDEERQLDLGTDECLLPLTLFTEMCHGFGALASLEINHNGKDSHSDKTGRRAYSPTSFIPTMEKWRAPLYGREPLPTIEMDHAKIRETIDKYAAAAYRCKRAGFKMCMIHGGHGNLIAQFASPLYNKRTDEWGGSLQNRARFAIEVLDGVRAQCGEDFVIEYRISADEIHPDGLHLAETLRFIELIQDKVDILHVSAGLHGEFEYMRNWWQNYLMDREYNVHYAASVKKAFPNKVVCTVGSIMNIARAEEIISSGKADMVAMCRPLLADPEMPRKYALGHEDDHRPCLRCQYCGFRLMVPARINCAVNPYLGNETEFPLGKVNKADVKRKVAVIGGGPAGIQALLTLCDRGHDVTLYEKSDHLGGSVVPGAALPFKQDVADYLAYLLRQADKAPARILLNTEATKEMLDVEGYEALVSRRRIGTHRPQASRHRQTPRPLGARSRHRPGGTGRQDGDRRRGRCRRGVRHRTQARGQGCDRGRDGAGYGESEGFCRRRRRRAHDADSGARDTHPSRLQARRGHRFRGDLPRREDRRASRVSRRHGTPGRGHGRAVGGGRLLAPQCPRDRSVRRRRRVAGGQHRHRGPVRLQSRCVYLASPEAAASRRCPGRRGLRGKSGYTRSSSVRLITSSCRPLWSSTKYALKPAMRTTRSL